MTTVAPPPPDNVVTGYASLAPYYDAFTTGYDYENWISGLERLARLHGLKGRRLLDVACGTGKSFLPFLERGYEVAACDISPAMVDAARSKLAAGAVDLQVADMRDLPDLGRFDLVTCLDDSVNYLLDDADLVAAMQSMARCLDTAGLLLFDCNSSATYQTAFRAQFVRESDDLFFSWRGDGEAPEGLASATIDVFARAATGWARSTSCHVQRHHPRASIEDALALAGLELVTARGQLPGGRLEPEVDEQRHTKVVYLARRTGHSMPTARKGVAA